MMRPPATIFLGQRRRGDGIAPAAGGAGGGAAVRPPGGSGLGQTRLGLRLSFLKKLAAISNRKHPNNSFQICGFGMTTCTSQKSDRVSCLNHTKATILTFPAQALLARRFSNRRLNRYEHNASARTLLHLLEIENECFQFLFHILLELRAEYNPQRIPCIPND